MKRLFIHLLALVQVLVAVMVPANNAVAAVPHSTWGSFAADSANWIADGGAERRSDGKRQRPALFDRELGRKPAYYAVREALAAAPAR